LGTISKSNKKPQAILPVMQGPKKNEHKYIYHGYLNILAQRKTGIYKDKANTYKGFRPYKSPILGIKRQLKLTPMSATMRTVAITCLAFGSQTNPSFVNQL
jgi:hypothetical protein